MGVHGQGCVAQSHSSPGDRGGPVEQVAFESGLGRWVEIEQGCWGAASAHRQGGSMTVGCGPGTGGEAAEDAEGEGSRQGVSGPKRTAPVEELGKALEQGTVRNRLSLWPARALSKVSQPHAWVSAALPARGRECPARAGGGGGRSSAEECAPPARESWGSEHRPALAGVSSLGPSGAVGSGTCWCLPGEVGAPTHVSTGKEPALHEIRQPGQGHPATKGLEGRGSAPHLPVPQPAC